MTGETAGKSGMGCGLLTAIIMLVIIVGALVSNEIFGYYLENCDEEEIFECLLSALEEEEEAEPEGVTATGVYSYKDYSVTVTMNIPLEGGSVTGSMSGTCAGPVKGNFSGQNNGVISGTITGGCSPFVVNIPASADFSGTVNKESEVVPINFTGRGGGFTKQDSMSLSY